MYLVEGGAAPEYARMPDGLPEPVRQPQYFRDVRREDAKMPL